MSRYNQTIKTVKDHLMSVIGLSRGGIADSVLHALFNDTAHVDEALVELLQSGAIGRETRKKINRYFSKTAWSDVAVGTVGDRLPGGRWRVRLDNAPEGMDFPDITVSAKRNIHGIEQGNRVFIQLAPIKSGGDPVLGARILARLGPKERVRIGGTARRTENGSIKFFPDNREIKTAFNIVASGKPLSLKQGDHYLAEMSSDFDIRKADLSLVERQHVDGSTGVPISRIIMRKFDFPQRPSSQAVIAAQKIIAQGMIGREPGRRDLTGLDFISADPQGAADRDDAVYAAPAEDGDGYRVIVAIADVAAWLKDETLNAAAARRGFTHYFPDRAFHMLPHAMAANHCSLKAGEDRAVLYTEFRIRGNGAVELGDIGPGVVRVRENFAYNDFNARVREAGSPYGHYAALHALFRFRRLEDNNPALGNPRVVSLPGGFSGESLVAALMVLTNRTVAEYLGAKGIPTLYRNNGPLLHEARYKHAAEVLASFGYGLPDDPAECTVDLLKDILGRARGKKHYDRLEEFVRREMIDFAEYGTRSQGHWSLDLSHYAHSTSPIRRYADVIVQKSLWAAFGHPDYGLKPHEIAQLDSVAASLNSIQLRQRDMARDYSRYHAVRDLPRLNGNVVRAQICNIRPDSIVIVLPHNGLRKRLHVGKDTSADGWAIDAVKKELIGHNANGQDIVRFRSGDFLRGHIRNVDPARGLWDFVLERPSGKPMDMDKKPDRHQRLTVG